MVVITVVKKDTHVEEVLKARITVGRSRIRSVMTLHHPKRGGHAPVQEKKTGKRRMRSEMRGRSIRMLRLKVTDADTRRGLKTGQVTIAKREGGHKVTREEETAGIETTRLIDRRTRKEIMSTVVNMKGIESAKRIVSMNETGIATGIETNLLCHQKAKTKVKTGKSAKGQAENLETRKGTILKRSTKIVIVLEGMPETNAPPKPHQKEKTMVKLVVEVTRVTNSSVMGVKKSTRTIERTTIARQDKTSLTTLETTSGISNAGKAVKRMIQNTN